MDLSSKENGAIERFVSHVGLGKSVKKEAATVGAQL